MNLVSVGDFLESWITLTSIVGVFEDSATNMNLHDALQDEMQKHLHIMATSEASYLLQRSASAVFSGSFSKNHEGTSAEFPKYLKK